MPRIKFTKNQLKILNKYRDRVCRNFKADMNDAEYDKYMKSLYIATDKSMRELKLNPNNPSHSDIENVIYQYLDAFSYE